MLPQYVLYHNPLSSELAGFIHITAFCTMNGHAHEILLGFLESFHIFLDSGNASFEGSGFKPSEGMVQVKVNQFQKTFLCGHGWTINEANVACRDLGFPAGAVSTEAVVPSNLSSECITATCRGIEMTLAECALTRLNQTSLPLAKVVCHQSNRECFPGEFLCVNRKCIPSEKTCDGIDDCGDLSDEVCCRACRAGSFHCHSDVCIPESYRCNNEKDCLTGEDESRRFCKHTLLIICNNVECLWWMATSIRIMLKNILSAKVTKEAEQSMDEERRKFKTFLPQLHCGILNRTVTRRKRILGGFTAEKDEFPWQVAIRSETQKVSCGGVYIGGCWILTAAHCV
ncbi:Complement factor I, partial [Varanus komodoensis]